MTVVACTINISILLFLVGYWRAKGLPRNESVLLFILTIVLILVPLANLFYMFRPLFKNIFIAIH